MTSASADPAQAREIDVPQFADPRGHLAALEQMRPLPFKPVRTFVISDVPPGAHRAQHKVSCAEFLWMVAGTCRAIVRGGEASGTDRERIFHLVARGSGLYLPKGVWLDLCDFSPGSILICVAEAGYVPRR